MQIDGITQTEVIFESHPVSVYSQVTDEKPYRFVRKIVSKHWKSSRINQINFQNSAGINFFIINQGNVLFKSRCEVNLLDMLTIINSRLQGWQEYP